MLALLPRRGLTFATSSFPKSSCATRSSSSLSSYSSLVSEFSIHMQLERVASLLHWDAMVTMPQTDAHHCERGLQSAALAGVIHEKQTSKKIGELINEINIEELEDEEKVNFELMQKIYREKTLIPETLAKEQAGASCFSLTTLHLVI